MGKLEQSAIDFLKSTRRLSTGSVVTFLKDDNSSESLIVVSFQEIRKKNMSKFSGEFVTESNETVKLRSFAFYTDNPLSYNRKYSTNDVDYDRRMIMIMREGSIAAMMYLLRHDKTEEPF